MKKELFISVLIRNFIKYYNQLIIIYTNAVYYELAYPHFFKRPTYNVSRNLFTMGTVMPFRKYIQPFKWILLYLCGRITLRVIKRTFIDEKIRFLSRFRQKKKKKGGPKISRRNLETVALTVKHIYIYKSNTIIRFTWCLRVFVRLKCVLITVRS